jgi:16S rRNA processing protein RimM
VPDEWVAVGRVGRPHGLGGAFVVENASEDPARFAEGARVWVGGEAATVVERKRAGNRLVVRVDRSLPRGAVIAVPAAELPEAEEGAFYVFELVGLSVEEEGGRDLGRVRSVAPGVANDVLELDSGLALPMVEECVKSVDRRAGRIIVAPGFIEPS